MPSNLADNEFSLEVIEEVVVVEVLPQQTDVFLETAYIQGPAGQNGDTFRRDLLTVTANGQTVFQLQAIARYPDRSSVSLNGVKAVYGSDYLLDNSVLTWLSDVLLETSDSLEVLYS